MWAHIPGKLLIKKWVSLPNESSWSLGNELKFLESDINSSIIIPVTETLRLIIKAELSLRRESKIQLQPCCNIHRELKLLLSWGENPFHFTLNTVLHFSVSLSTSASLTGLIFNQIEISQIYGSCQWFVFCETWLPACLFMFSKSRPHLHTAPLTQWGWMLKKSFSFCFPCNRSSDTQTGSGSSEWKPWPTTTARFLWTSSWPKSEGNNTILNYSSLLKYWNPRCIH